MRVRARYFSFLSVLTLLVGLSLARPEASQAQACEPVFTLPFVFLGGSAPDLTLFPGCFTAADNHEDENLTELVPKSIDSPSLTKSGGNPYKQIGTWNATFSSLLPFSGNAGSYHPVLFLGLRNSDDEGTKFDVKVELLVGGDVVSQGETHCISGVTRNPTKAKEVHITPFPALNGIPFVDPPPVIFDVDPDVEFSLRVSARIGTADPVSGDVCRGHASALGLRLYYDAKGRGSRIRIGGVPCPPDQCLPPIRD